MKGPGTCEYQADRRSLDGRTLEAQLGRLDIDRHGGGGCGGAKLKIRIGKGDAVGFGAFNTGLGKKKKFARGEVRRDVGIER